MQRRISLIAKFRKSGHAPITAILVVLILAVLTLTDAKTSERSKEKVEAPSAGAGSQLFVNSLGMNFLQVGNLKVSIWETRVKDFAAFVNATGYDASEGGISISQQGMVARGNYWNSPGFEQSPLHPVCLVSWEDADAFCYWLTRKELQEGIIHANQFYRLPTSKEWAMAFGSNKFAWGGTWPPPPNSGNFGGIEAQAFDWPARYRGLAGYNDGFARTAPVATFPPNSLGIYDMNGNVWEWCQEWYAFGPSFDAARDPNIKPGQQNRTYRLLRGGSWVSYTESAFKIATRRTEPPHQRYDTSGFRCVLVTSATENIPHLLVKIRCIDAASQKALSHRSVNVAFTLNDRGRSAYTKQTDADGVFEVALAGDTPGPITLTVRSDGYVPKRYVWTQEQGDALPRTVDFALEQAHTIGGIVRNQSGVVVPGATVVISGFFSDEKPVSLPRYSLRATADANGQWMCKGVPATWKMLTFALYHPSYAPANLQTEPTELN